MLLLLSPMLLTSLSLSFFILQTGIMDLLSLKETFHKRTRHYSLTIILFAFGASNVVILTQLQNTIELGGSYIALYFVGIITNIMCTWLITNWF